MIPWKKFFIAQIFSSFICSPIYAQNDKVDLLGWVEYTKIREMDAKVKMKIDTGALTSSMHAKNIEEFKKEGEDWVRFNVDLLDEETGKVKSELFERKIFRNLIVKGAGGKDRRYVVLMTICVGNIYYEEQFSLRDRSEFIYPILIGRRAIQHWGLVDVNQTFENPPVCTSDSNFVPYFDKQPHSSKIGL